MQTEEKQDVSVGEFQGVIDSWLEVRKEIDDIEESLKPLQEKRRELESQIVNYMDATGLEKFQGKLGSVQRRLVDYVNQPDDENRHKFLEFLINSGELSDVITFHQGRLTSWFKHKKEELGFDWTAPGIGEMKQRTELRRGK